MLIVALVAVLWLDESLDRAAAPAWASQSLGGSETFPPGLVIFAVMAVAAFMAARELARILREKSIAAETWLACASALAGLLVSCLVPSGLPADLGVAATSTVAIFVLLASMAHYSRGRNTEGVIAAAGGSLLAFVYLGLMFGFLLAIRREHSAWVLAWILLTTKMSDTGAYFAGRAFGRHKLIPWLSPGKTWEGLVGGVILAAAVGAGGLAVLRGWTHAALPPVWSGAVAGAAAAIFGQLGDLVMSLFKRDAGRKDSGHSLPGFGGVLDVLDSPLLVAPLAFWWLRLAA